MFKSIFVVTYLTIATIVAVRSAIAIVGGAALLADIGVFLTSGPIAKFVGSIMLLQNRARTSDRLWTVMVLAIIGTGLSLYAFLVGTGSQTQALTAAAMTGLYFLYDFWYSRLERSDTGVSVGQPLPAITLASVDGDTVTTADLAGSPAILIFFRGNWCPLCMAQIKEVAARYNELSDLGVRVLMVSPQPQRHTSALAKKIDAAMEFMRDDNNAAAKALGLESRFGTPFGMQALGYDSDTVLPTVIIIDGAGVVQWVHATDNYRVRPEPDTFFEVLREKGLVVAS